MTSNDSQGPSRARAILRGRLLAPLLGAVLGGCLGVIGDGADGSATPTGGFGAASSSSGGPGALPGETPLRRMTTTEYVNTAADLLGVARETVLVDGIRVTSDGEFDNSGDSFSVSVTLVEQLLLLAESLAKGADLQALFACDVAAKGEDACMKGLVTSFGARAYRRPLTQEEADAYAALFTKVRADDDYDTSIRAVITRMLVAPEFLHHVEVGDSPPADGSSAKVTPYELASRLSYLVWESMPDDALFQAAASGGLATPDDLEKQASRLLADPRAKTTVRHVHTQWLELDRLGDLPKDETLYPGFAAAEPAVLEGTLRFVDDVVWNGPGDVNALLTSPTTFANGDLASLYGFKANGPDFTRIDLDPSQRVGVLMQPAFLSVFGKASKSSPILRGVFVLKRLLCAPLGAPPPGANNIPPNAPPAATTRDFFTNLTSPSTCQSCHGTINPIGFGLEHFDAIGAYRDKENGHPIDATGEVKVGAHPGKFDGGVALAQLLAASGDVQGCLVRQWFRYAYGRTEVDGDKATLSDVEARFQAQQGKILSLPIALTQTDAFTRIHYKGAVQ